MEHARSERFDQAMKHMNQVADTPDKEGSPTSYQATVQEEPCRIMEQSIQNHMTDPPAIC